MYDYFVVGQGIAGSILGYLLHKAGQKIRIIDSGDKNASSVAGALINPITGKRLSKSWRTDCLIPFAYTFYKKIEKEFNISVFRSLPLVRVFSSVGQANDWDSKLLDPAYLSYIWNKAFTPDLSIVDSSFGYAILKHAAYIDSALLMSAFSDYFKANDLLRHGVFDTIGLAEGSIPSFKNESARNIIFCDGWQIKNNPLFKGLPILPSKGDVFTLTIPNLHSFDYILSKGIFLLPLSGNKIRCGSTYRWDDFTQEPTRGGFEALEQKLKRILTRPYRILDHQAGIRPGVQDRRPILGRHPYIKNVYVFGGLGTKGYSLAPFFARQMFDFLIEGTPLEDAVNVKRFYNRLSRVSCG